MNFKKWVKNIQSAGYNGARTVVTLMSYFGLKFKIRDIFTKNYVDIYINLFFFSFQTFQEPFKLRIWQ